jgi:hypothetical protein
MEQQNQIVRVNFNKEHKAMLGRCKMILERDGGRIAINPGKFDKLITALVWVSYMNRLATAIHHRSIITKLIEDCYNESDIDNKVQILYKVNSLLPRMCRINIPSLITDDYIDTVLFKIEKRSMHCL